MKRIILASQSPRRSQLLREHGYSIEISPSNLEEAEHLKRPSALVMHNAAIKATEVARQNQDNLVLGADTVIYFQGQIIGKPKTKEHAFRILNKLQGRKHWVYTGVCLIWLSKKIRHTFFDKTEIRFKKLSPADIRNYHAKINAMDKAGAYAVNEHGDMILAGYRGSFTNIVGLPMEKLAAELSRFICLAVFLGGLAGALLLQAEPVLAKALDPEKLRDQIAENKIERGWSSLSTVLEDANKGEKNAAVRAANRRVVDELVGRSGSSRQKTYLVSNYNNSLKNRLGGKDHVMAEPETKDLPWIKMELVFGEKKKANKIAKIWFNAAYGKVRYSLLMKRQNIAARHNAVMFSIKSGVPRLRFILLTENGDRKFEFDGLKDAWQVVTIPYAAFEGFNTGDEKVIKGFEILVDGEEMPEEQLKGEFYLEDFQLVDYREEELKTAREEVEKYRYQLPASFITDMYQERERF